MLIPPPVIAVAAALVQRRLAHAAARPSVPCAVSSGALAAGSLALAASAAARFRRAGTTVEPFDPSKASVLVTGGVNAATRNPMYVGMAGVLLANGIRLGSWASLVPVAGFVAVIDRLQVAQEEAALSRIFGREYDDYRAAVPRWLDGRTLRRLPAAWDRRTG